MENKIFKDYTQAQIDQVITSLNNYLIQYNRAGNANSAEMTGVYLNTMCHILKDIPQDDKELISFILKNTFCSNDDGVNKIIQSFYFINVFFNPNFTKI